MTNLSRCSSYAHVLLPDLHKRSSIAGVHLEIHMDKDRVGHEIVGYGGGEGQLSSIDLQSGDGSESGNKAFRSVIINKA